MPHSMGPLLFLIMISDIDNDVSASKLVSFADDTRLYAGAWDVTDCDNIQIDFNAVYNNNNNVLIFTHGNNGQHVNISFSAVHSFMDHLSGY